MNRTLLLIICDFLLLNLLALTRWDALEPEKQRTPPAELVVSGATGVKEDLVASLREALAEEQARRETLGRQMGSEAAAREAVVAELQNNLTQARQSATQLDQKLAAEARKATETQQLLGQAQARLDEAARAREALAESVKAAEAERRKLQDELERQRKEAATLAAARSEAEQKVASLSSAVKVAEAEKQLLRENVNDLKGQVTRVQEEKSRLQEQASTLAQGVTQLARSSDAFKQELRDNQPLNANLLYAAFLTNRVNVRVTGTQPGLFGTSAKERETATILVTDGTNTVALLHVNETPFSLGIPGFGLDQLAATVGQGGRSLAAGRPYLSARDPRLVGVPVDPGQARAGGLRIYPLARNPFQFADAVLVSRGGKYYGEVEFRLDPQTPEFVRMKTQLFSRVFGEFSPSAGDLVLGRTGELLGVMVNGEYCVVLGGLRPAAGGVFEAGLGREEMGRKLELFRAQLNRLPPRLQ